MMEPWITTRNRVSGALYRRVVRPVFFSIDPENIHDRMTRTGMFLGRHRLTRSVVHTMLTYQHPMLEQTIHGIDFKNPIGLAAGFDKDANLTEILPHVGFGFAEVGSITGEPCAGNTGQRLWRLKKSKGLVVYYGLKNAGCDVLSKKISEKEFAIPIGISVAKTNNQETCDLAVGVADYKKAFSAFASLGSYITVNISCPNTFGGEPFTDPVRLEKLLVELDQIPTSRPVFLKFSPDLAPTDVDALLDVATRHRVHGFICSNLTKKRDTPRLVDANVPKVGGISGKIVQPLADKLIEHVYKKTKGKYTIIGCGGVFTAQDAYRKIRLGASLIQLITGMIYQGPQVISEINQGLVHLLNQDGYTNITEAVGTAHFKHDRDDPQPDLEQSKHDVTVARI